MYSKLVFLEIPRSDCCVKRSCEEMEQEWEKELWMRERGKSLILFLESMANDHKIFKYVVDSVDVSVFGSYLDGFHFSSQPNSLSLLIHRTICWPTLQQLGRVSVFPENIPREKSAIIVWGREERERLKKFEEEKLLMEWEWERMNETKINKNEMLKSVEVKREWMKKERNKTNSTRASHVVTHRTTDQARWDLTSQSGRDGV